MRSIKSLAGALAGTLALAGVTALGAAAPAAAITPTEAANGAGYGGYSSGAIAHIEAVGTTATELTRAELAQSSAGVGVGQGLVDIDTLDSKILFADQAGKNAYGHGAGLSLSLGQAPGTTPSTTLALAEALSPPASTDEDIVLDVPVDPLVSADVLEASAQANTTTLANPCLTGGATLISQGTAQAADATILDPADVAGLPVSQPVVQLDGTSESISENRLVPLAGGKFGLSTFTTQTLAPLTLLGGTPLETRIEVLKDIRLRATASGTAGGGNVFYGFVNDDGSQIVETDDTTPVLTVVALDSAPLTLTSQDVFGDEGLRLNLGVIDVFIGADSSENIAADGTTAAGTADFIRIESPGTLPTGTTPVITDGPLAPIGGVLDPITDALAPVTDAIQDALESAGITLADIRYGHLEALAKVPVGGITCGPTEDPLRNAFKDVSALGVVAGATFNYTVRFPNDGKTPLTNVRVVDTFTGGPPPLEFISSVPAPTSRADNVLTYDIGTIEPGTFREITFTFRVPADARVGTKYMNSAKITATFEGRQIEKVVEKDAPTVIPALTGPCAVDRSTKFASNKEVATGQEFAYFINVSNTGGAECTGVTVTDELVAGVSFVSCSDNCTNAGQRVTFSVGTLASGASRTLKIVVKVTATTGTLPNAADITTDQGAKARPSTEGPRVTGNSVGNPGVPAGCPAIGCTGAEGTGRDLPETGLGTTAPLLGVVALLLVMAIRRRGDLIG